MESVISHDVTFWLSIGLGAAVGLAYNLCSYLTQRWAMRFNDNRFLQIFFGGLVTRFVVTLTLLAVILVSAPVDQLTFVGSFAAFFLVGLAVEVMTLHRAGLHRSED